VYASGSSRPHETRLVCLSTRRERSTQPLVASELAVPVHDKGLRANATISGARTPMRACRSALQQEPQRLKRRRYADTQSTTLGRQKQPLAPRAACLGETIDAACRLHGIFTPHAATEHAHNPCSGAAARRATKRAAHSSEQHHHADHSCAASRWDKQPAGAQQPGEPWRRDAAMATWMDGPDVHT
jgi:hypothetical protein